MDYSWELESNRQTCLFCYQFLFLHIFFFRPQAIFIFCFSYEKRKTGCQLSSLFVRVQNATQLSSILLFLETNLLSAFNDSSFITNETTPEGTFLKK